MVHIALSSLPWLDGTRTPSQTSRTGVLPAMSIAQLRQTEGQNERVPYPSPARGSDGWLVGSFGPSIVFPSNYYILTYS